MLCSRFEANDQHHPSSFSTPFMQHLKRSHSPGDEPAAIKKRVVADENGSPRVNGVVSEQEAVEREPSSDDNLEVTPDNLFFCLFF
jgi:hypothetical protein